MVIKGAACKSMRHGIADNVLEAGVIVGKD